ncbi:signal peptidase I [Betaproteobacteria bacterium]|nr:signal peptidase I [Betaproteobacteria bacterium]
MGLDVNFALVLFILLVATGIPWVIERFYARSRRSPDAPEPFWVEYGASFFPVVLIVFALRSFVVEPFQIPSGSMTPTLLEGDFILVNKYNYGIRLPLLDKKIIDIGDPRRGDVMVFHNPMNPAENYIKRVVGLPGDRVEYINKRLTINGEVVATLDAGTYLHTDRLYYSPQYLEHLGGVEHNILIEHEAPPYVGQIMNYPYRENCTYTVDGVRCTVPAGYYFMMGDNRDASSDSRVWGFVPDENIVGRAFFIWFNFKNLKRVGRFH